MDKEKNIATIKQLYADVGTKNMVGILTALTDDIVWEPPFVPEIQYTKLRNGKSEVKDWAMEMAAVVTYTQVTSNAIYADNDVVIVKGFFDGKANATGKSFQSDWVHIWKFRDDKICSHQAFWNTHRVAVALK